MDKCTKYTNPHETTFLTCKYVNRGRSGDSIYLHVTDMYSEYINYCPNCGSKLTAMGYVNKNGKEVWCDLDD